jgi:Leucine-rich repeat (LRR) protein
LLQLEIQYKTMTPEEHHIESLIDAFLGGLHRDAFTLTDRELSWEMPMISLLADRLKQVCAGYRGVRLKVVSNTMRRLPNTILAFAGIERITICAPLKEIGEELRPLFSQVTGIELDDFDLEEIPRWIFECPRIEVLYLTSGSYFRGLPTGFASAQTLSSLLVARCPLVNQMPMEELAQLPSLKYLNFNETPITQISPSISNLKSLQYLEVRDCSLLTNLPSELACLPNLEYIDFKGTGIRRIPPELLDLPKLRYIGVPMELGFMGFVAINKEHLSPEQLDKLYDVLD